MKLGDYRMTWPGKYDQKCLSDIPIGYLEWALQQKQMNKPQNRELQKAIIDYLESIASYSGHFYD